MRPKLKQTQRRRYVLQIYLSPAEEKRIRKQAAADALRLSQWARQRLLQEAR